MFISVAFSMHAFIVDQLPFCLTHYFFSYANDFHQLQSTLLTREPFCLIKMSLHISVDIHLMLIEQFNSQGRF